MAASQVPTKSREERDALGCGYLNVITKALTFSPSIVSYAGEQGAEKPFQTPIRHPHQPIRHLDRSGEILKTGINLAISLLPHRRRPLSFGLAQKKQNRALQRAH